MECLSSFHPSCLDVNPLLHRWSSGDYGDYAEEGYDPKSLLPVVTPILDEYEYEYEQAPKSPEGVDSCRTVDPQNDNDFSDDSDQERDSRAYSVESELDEKRDGQPRMTEELLRFHEVALQKLGSHEKLESFVSEGSNNEGNWEEDSDDIMVGAKNSEQRAHVDTTSRASCPRLPRPRLWTLSERGESSASQASALNDLRRSSSGAEKVVDKKQDQFHFVSEEDISLERSVSDLTSAEETAPTEEEVPLSPSQSPSATSNFRRNKLNDVKKKLLSRPLLGRSASASSELGKGTRQDSQDWASISTISEQSFNAHDESFADGEECDSPLKMARKKLSVRMPKISQSIGIVAK